MTGPSRNSTTVQDQSLKLTRSSARRPAEQTSSASDGGDLVLTITLDAAQINALLSELPNTPSATTVPASRHRTHASNSTESESSSYLLPSAPTGRHIRLQEGGPFSEDAPSETQAPSAAVTQSNSLGNSDYASRQSALQDSTSAGSLNSQSRAVNASRQQSASPSASQSADPNPASASSSTTTWSTVTATTTIHRSTSTSRLTTSTMTVFSGSFMARPIVTETGRLGTTEAGQSGLTTVTMGDGRVVTSQAAPTSTATSAGPSAGSTTSFHTFLRSLGSSPAAVALTTLVCTSVVAMAGILLYLCIRKRRPRTRRPSLFDWAPDAKMLSSDQDKPASRIDPFISEKYSMGPGSQDATPILEYAPSMLDVANANPHAQGEVDYAAEGERRRSSADLSLVYHLRATEAVGQETSSILSTQAEASVGHSPLSIQAGRLGSSPLAQPPTSRSIIPQLPPIPSKSPARPPRPPFGLDAFTKDPWSPRSSMSSLAIPALPWTRQPRKWASVSSMGGASDRRVDRQQLPSRFSVTTIAPSMEASPDLGVFRPRRAAMIASDFPAPISSKADQASGLAQVTNASPVEAVDPFEDQHAIGEEQSKNPFADLDLGVDPKDQGDDTADMPVASPVGNEGHWLATNSEESLPWASDSPLICDKPQSMRKNSLMPTSDI